MSLKPLCFVAMPFGIKRDPHGGPDINFDRIYDQAIGPAIESADMEVIRADNEVTGGIIQKTMFERLLFSDFVVADLTSANANVFYELGIRHATRPYTTITIFAEGQGMPFDVNYLRSLPYELGQNNSFEAPEAEMLKNRLGKQLKQARIETKEYAIPDSPLFQLMPEYSPPDLGLIKPDVLRKQEIYTKQIIGRLRAARTIGLDMVDSFRKQLNNLDQVQAEVLIELLLVYRSHSAHSEVIKLYGQLPKSLRDLFEVQKIVAFTESRLGNTQKAMEMLEDLLHRYGPSSEIYGLIGGEYKNRWRRARESHQAHGYLVKAIDAYRKGFETDWREPYSGIRLLVLLECKGDDESLRQERELLPVVKYAIERRLMWEKPDFWVYASLMELRILENDRDGAFLQLSNALSSPTESWQLLSTLSELELIREARQNRNDLEAWFDEFIDNLRRADNLNY